MNRTTYSLMTVFLLAGALSAADEQNRFWEELKPDVHGFYEVRSGYRLQNDPQQKDMSLMEARTQIDLQSLPEWGTITVKGDAYGDVVTERGEFDRWNH